MGLIKTLLFILLFYYGFKVLSRIFAPLFLKFVVKKAGQRYGNSGNYQKSEPQYREGEVVIDKMPNKKSSNNSVGEYVDFEEVD